MNDQANTTTGPPRARSCTVCGGKFRAHVRLKERQKVCGAAACQRARRRAYLRKWRRLNADASLGYVAKHRKPQGYWPRYRGAHPESTSRNREASKLRAALKREGLQRNLDIAQATETSGKIEAFVGFATIHRCSIERAFGREDSS